MVGDDDHGGAGHLVDADLLHPGGLEGLGDELEVVLGVGDDVDLLASELGDDLADARTAGTDAGADGVDVGLVGGHGHLGAVAWLTRARLDLDDAVGDLGHLELEQLQDQAGVRAGHDDLRTLGGLADLDDVGLEPGVVLGALVRDLLGLGQQRLDPTEVEQRVTAVVLLDDAGDDVALAAGVLLVLELALSLADALGHHLTGGLGGDATEVVGRDVELLADRHALLVEFLGEDPDVEGAGVDRDPRVLVGLRHPLVRGLERVGQCGHEGVDGDALLGREGLEGVEHVGAAHDRAFLFLGPALA